jgi:hypothetical protein
MTTVSAPSRPRHTLMRLAATAALVLLVAAGTSGQIVTPRTAVAAQFSSGEIVRVVDGSLNLRTEPGLDAEVVRVLPDGFVLTVADGPESADGYDWYQVTSSGDVAVDGWVVGDFLEPAPGGEFPQGTGVRVVGGSLNVRDAPSLSGNVFTTVPEGTTFTAGDPTFADGYTWYKVHSFGIVLPLPSNQGWVAGDFLVADPGVTGCEGQGPCPSGLGIGDGIRVVTDSLNLRDAPVLDAAVVAVLPTGVQGVVLEFADNTSGGHAWLRVETVDYGSGWVARDFVVADPSANGGPEFSIGSTVQVVDGTLKLRASATLAADVLNVMADGTILTVENGPVVSDGYTWYRVSSDAYGTGWAAGEYLAPV